jgi:uncharacterized protein YbjT (DUF2867 family)
VTGLVAVTGATGGIGGRVATHLAAAGVAQRLIVRDASRAPDVPGAEVAVAPGYRDRAGMVAALRGAQTLFLVSGRESADRVAEHVSAVDAAVEAGVQRIAYLSFLAAAPDTTFTFGRDHWHTEQHIRATGLDFTFLRDNMYLDYVPMLASAEGVIAGPAGDGRLAAVSRDDVGAAAAAVLSGAGHEGAVYELTGPEAFTLAEAAAVLSEVTGRPVRYHAETEEEAYASRARYGAPDFEVAGWVTSYAAIANGELERVTRDVERLTGRRPQDLRAFLAAHPDSVAHLTA